MPSSVDAIGSDVTMGGCEDQSITSLALNLRDGQSHNLTTDEDYMDMSNLPNNSTDKNDDDDDSGDDDDDAYDGNDLDLFVDGPSSPAHSKKSDKTKWCEREVI